MQLCTEKTVRLCRILSGLIIFACGYIVTINVTASSINNLSEDLEKIAVKTVPSIVSIIGVSSNHNAGIGTGIFITEEGHILTNFHVIANHEVLIVGTSDGRLYREVPIVGCDQETDIAVLKIEPQTPMQPLEFGDSSKVLPGQVVCAIGHGNTHKNSITMGIVSALREQLPEYMMEEISYLKLIQTDVPVHHGNSGGPLLDLKGKCIGINVMIDVNIKTGEDSWQGISYSIDGNFAKKIADRIIEDGFVKRGYFGAEGQDLSIGLKNAFNLSEKNNGVLIANVKKGSPADKGGLKVGDIVLSIGDINVESAQQLRIEASLSPINKPVSFSILRDNKKFTLSITPIAPEYVEPTIIERMEIMVENPVDENRDISEGLLVTDINIHSPFFYINAFSELKGAGSSGLNSGERILKFNGQKLKTVSDLEEAVEKVKPGKRILMLVKGRNGEIRFVTGILP